LTIISNGGKMWFKNNSRRFPSDEFESLSKKLVELHTEMGISQAKIKILETNLDNLRGNINARLLRRFKKEEEEDKQEEDKSINNPVILPFHGTFK